MTPIVPCLLTCFAEYKLLVHCPECESRCLPDLTQPPFTADRAATLVVISLTCQSCGYSVSLNLDFAYAR